jgi:LysM repeat protein
LKTTDKYGEFALDIRAIKAQTGLPALLTSIVIIASACSSTPKSPATENIAQNAQTTEEVQPFEPVSGSIAASESEAEATHSSEIAAISTENIEIKADYPQKYTVVKGDTLWDIASKFLKDPWYWPEIWYRNPQVQNPHLIYPGDILTLIYVNGRPQIQVTRASNDEVIRKETSDTSPQGLKVVKLTPNIRRKSLDAAIPVIPSDAVRQFLTKPRVISLDEWEQAPYIVGSDDAHLILGSDNKIYIRGELDKERIRYSVFRRGAVLKDPESNDILGYEIVYAGQARISNYGSPSTGVLLETKREVLIGDRLLPTDKSSIEQLYYPKVPEGDVEGQIISLFDAISSIAKYQVAVINRGRDHGIENGHLLATYQKGVLARDRFLSNKKVKRGEEKKLMVQLPDERSGLMMIFKSFEKVSYGLVIESTRVIQKYDMVKKPR